MKVQMLEEIEQRALLIANSYFIEITPFADKICVSYLKPLKETPFQHIFNETEKLSKPMKTQAECVLQTDKSLTFIGYKPLESASSINQIKPNNGDLDANLLSLAGLSIYNRNVPVFHRSYRSSKWWDTAINISNWLVKLCMIALRITICLRHLHA